MVTDREELTRLPGPFGSALPPEVLAALPATTPGPPWHCRVRGAVWAHPAAPAATALLPAEVRGRATVPLTVGAALHYPASPVGPYHEVAAVPRALVGLVPTGYVPFVAVDSPASLRGGRVHWALPKVPARFGPGPGGVPAHVVGAGWRLWIRARPFGPALPFVVRLDALQPRPGGAPVRLRAALTGWTRYARVTVGVEAGEELGRWLLPGRHHGLVIVAGRLTVD